MTGEPIHLLFQRAVMHNRSSVEFANSKWGRRGKLIIGTGARCETNYAILVTLPPNPMGGVSPAYKSGGPS